MCRYLPSIYYRFVFSCGTFCFCLCPSPSHPATLNGHHVRHGNTQLYAHRDTCCKCVCVSVCVRCFYDCLFIYLAGSLGFPAGCFVLVLVHHPLHTLPPAPPPPPPLQLLSSCSHTRFLYSLLILFSFTFCIRTFSPAANVDIFHTFSASAGVCLCVCAASVCVYMLSLSLCVCGCVCVRTCCDFARPGRAHHRPSLPRAASTRHKTRLRPRDSSSVTPLHPYHPTPPLP